VLGEGYWTILRRHLLPNLAGIVLVYLTLAIPSVIIDEAFLSFLDWACRLLNRAGALFSPREQPRSIPCAAPGGLLLFPSLALLSTLLSLYNLGDALRRRERGQ